MPPERRAVLLLLGLAVGGQGIRACLALPGEAPGQLSLLQAGPPLSSAQAHRDSSLALSRPLGKQAQRAVGHQVEQHRVEGVRSGGEVGGEVP